MIFTGNIAGVNVHYLTKYHSLLFIFIASMIFQNNPKWVTSIPTTVFMPEDEDPTGLLKSPCEVIY